MAIVICEVKELNGKANEGRENCENHLLPKVCVHFRTNLLQYLNDLVNTFDKILLSQVRHNNVC